MLVTRINLAYTRNSYELGRKIKQVKMGKSQKRKCKRLTVHLTYFGGKQMKTQLPLFTFKTPQIWDKGSTRYWWPVKKWALCCKADGKADWQPPGRATCCAVHDGARTRPAAPDPLLGAYTWALRGVPKGSHQGTACRCWKQWSRAIYTAWIDFLRHMWVKKQRHSVRFMWKNPSRL